MAGHSKEPIKVGVSHVNTEVALRRIDEVLKELSLQYKGVALQRRKGTLFLRASLPDPSQPGTRKQDRINLHLAAEMANLAAAENFARKLSRQLGTNSYEPRD